MSNDTRALKAFCLCLGVKLLNAKHMVNVAVRVHTGVHWLVRPLPYGIKDGRLAREGAGAGGAHSVS